MKLSEALAAFVESAVRERGLRYFQSRLVKIKALLPDAVIAQVRGSDDYHVNLTLENSAIHASCDCPYIESYGSACKHIWATILAAENTGFGTKAAALTPLALVLSDGNAHEDDDDDDSDLDDFVLPPRRLPPRPAAPRREKWEEQLASLQREFQPPPKAARAPETAADRQLVYVVDAQTSEPLRKLVLEIQVQERKLNGDWGKPRPRTVSPGDVSQLADPTDAHLFSLLGGADRGNAYGFNSAQFNYGVSRFRVDGPLLETVLPLLAQTNRLCLRKDPHALDLEYLTADLEPAWELEMSVGRDEKPKRWVLTGQFRRGDETLPLAAPGLVLPGLLFWNARFGRLDAGEAFAWIPHLRKITSISVPYEKGDEFLGQLLTMPRPPRLTLPEALQVAETTATPRPRLVVKQPKNHYHSEAVLHGELSFDYDGQLVPAVPAGRGVFDPNGKRFLLRDQPAERAAAQELQRVGFRAGSYGQPDKLELKPAQLPKAVRTLVGGGWKVEAEGKLYRQANAFQLNVRSENDWFDLSATADFEGKSVPLPRLLEALKRGESSVLLDDGSLGMVPEDWLKKFGLFAAMGTVEGDKVRFSKAQVGLLDALLATRPEVTFDKAFARARDELRKFSGIAPVDPPAAFKGELREYQREGLGWLQFLRKFGFGGCLADDMGLGKTVQVLAMLAGKRKGPALVVVPRSLVFNWKQEAARFAPHLKVLDHTGLTRDRTGAAFKDHDLILTTYGTLRRDAAMIAEVRFDTCVLDESQAAKNADTDTAKAVRLVRANHRLAMSGTPVENHLGELWTLFDFLNPGMLGRASLLGGAAGPGRNPDPETREILAQALRPYILRRTKSEVAKDLPEKTEKTEYCDLEPEQRKLYDELRDHYRQALLARVDSQGMGRSKIQVLEALLRLRQAACHPGLIDKKRVKESSAKLDVLLPQLQELAEQGTKALVFSQFTSFLAIVRERLDAAGVPYEYLDGRTRDRAARVERFQTDPDCHLFLISLKAGGVGLNLTAAEYVFLLDPWWNPAVEAQAIDRSHRIGQTKPVFAYRLIARDTVEEKVLALQQSKRELADAILGGDGRLITDLKREDLELLLS